LKKVLVLVEGQTEETFIRDVIYSFFMGKGICLCPVVIKTKRTKSGSDFKGGISSYGKIKNDLMRLLNDSSAVAVTTMIDFYRLPKDFPGKEKDLPNDCYDQVAMFEEQFSKNINNSRFMPYLSLHEFEALILVSPEEINKTIIKNTDWSELITAIQTAGSPERVNDGDTIHPSARILSKAPSYTKALHGSIITKRIGLDRIRTKCQHFNQWITKLENLS